MQAIIVVAIVVVAAAGAAAGTDDSSRCSGKKIAVVSDIGGRGDLSSMTWDTKVELKPRRPSESKWLSLSASQKRTMFQSRNCSKDPDVILVVGIGSS